MATKAPTTEEGYPGKRAAEIAGITYRQLDYWARTDLVMPSLARATGSGSRRLYSYRDLLELRAVKSLLDAGIRLDLCLLYTSPSPRDLSTSRMPSSA